MFAYSEIRNFFWWGLSWFCGLRFAWFVSQASQRRYFLLCTLWLVYLAYFFLLESVSQTNTLSSWTCTLFPRPFNINDIMPSWDPVWYFHHSRFVIHQQLSISKNMVCKIFNTMFYHICQCRVFVMTVREKGRYPTQSYDISPYTDRLIQNATWQHNNATKNYRLHNDCVST